MQTLKEFYEHISSIINVDCDELVDLISSHRFLNESISFRITKEIAFLNNNITDNTDYSNSLYEILSNHFKDYSDYDFEDMLTTKYDIILVLFYLLFTSNIYFYEYIDLDKNESYRYRISNIVLFSEIMQYIFQIDIYKYFIKEKTMNLNNIIDFNLLSQDILIKRNIQIIL